VRSESRDLDLGADQESAVANYALQLRLALLATPPDKSVAWL
jgi:hypothetical protein